MIGRLPAALIAVSLLSASVAAAQRAPSLSGRPATGGRATAIRAELAQVLLQSRQYDDAAREYRALLQQNPSNRSYRLNLARALAWGERFSEAEAELRILAAQQPGNATVDALQLTVRKALSPPGYQAARWLAERPGSAEYRRILARALAREGRTAEAFAHYDTLLARQRTADLLLERAYVHLQRRKHAEAETDLIASINVGPTVEALVQLGDLKRWRGDLGSAHSLFSRARRIAPTSPAVSAAFARLARDERPAAAFIPQASDAAGWQTTTTTAADNLGALLTTVAVRRGFAIPRGLEASAGAKLLRLSDRFVNAADEVPPGAGGGSVAAVTGAANGVGADFALSGEAEYREMYARARVRAGFVHHPSADLVPDAAFTLTAWVRAWGAGVETSTGPAYPTFFTMASFVPLPGTETQLRERTAAVSVAGPLRRLDVALRTQSSALSDGNRRASIEGFARLPVLPRIALLYSGSTLAFAQPSPLYWDPSRYTVHSAGVEYSIRRWRGLYFAARALPGLAWSSERATIDSVSSARRASPQLSVGAEAGHRGDSWEIGTTLGYGRGRTGSYERFDALVQVRYIP